MNQPNQVGAADISYIAAAGILYPLAIIEWATRREPVEHAEVL